MIVQNLSFAARHVVLCATQVFMRVAPESNAQQRARSLRIETHTLDFRREKWYKFNRTKHDDPFQFKILLVRKRSRDLHLV